MKADHERQKANLAVQSTADCSATPKTRFASTRLEAQQRYDDFLGALHDAQFIVLPSDTTAAYIVTMKVSNFVSRLVLEHVPDRQGYNLRILHHMPFYEESRDVTDLKPSQLIEILSSTIWTKPSHREIRRRQGARTKAKTQARRERNRKQARDLVKSLGYDDAELGGAQHDALEAITRPTRRSRRKSTRG